MMIAPDASAEAPREPAPAGLVEAGVYRTEAEGLQHSLVVLAMGAPCWLVERGGDFALLVEPVALSAAREQLACFDRESAGWPPPVDAPSPAGSAGLTPLVWALLVLLTFRAQAMWPILTEAGALDVRAVFDRGELWRAATALFLHADTGHVVANVLSGLLVLSAVLSTFGQRLGWLLLTAAAIMGNLAVAAVYYTNHYRSLGASTGIFAGCGLLTGQALREAAGGAGPRRRWQAFARLGAGLTILGLYGAGAERVDVLAHGCGFLAGLLCGLLAPKRWRVVAR